MDRISRRTTIVAIVLLLAAAWAPGALGESPRFYAGLHVMELTADLKEAFGYSGTGVMVAKTLPDSPAQRAGLEQGDVITQVGGTPITDSESFVAAIQSGAEEQPAVELVIHRGKRLRTVTVQRELQRNRVATPPPGQLFTAEENRALQDFAVVMNAIEKSYLDPLPLASHMDRAVAAVYRQAGEAPHAANTSIRGVDETQRQLERFAQAVRDVSARHAQLSTAALVHAGMEALAQADPLSAYVPAEDLTTAGPGAVGVELKKVDSGIVVVRAIPGSPAAGTDIRAGDRLSRIDGAATDGMELAEVVKRLQGAVGSEVRLSMVRGAVSWTLPLRRTRVSNEAIECPAVRRQVAYVRLRHFQSDTAERLKETLARLEQEGGPLRGLVLDLRDNQGGVLSAAAGVSNLFMDQGRILVVEQRSPSGHLIINAAAANAAYPDLPLKVLINERTASGAEMVAASLQDQQRATIMGRPTAGASTVQTLFPMQQGYFKLTTARLSRPSGKPLSEGIAPDIIIPYGSAATAGAWHPCGAALRSTEEDGDIQRAWKKTEQEASTPVK